MKKDKLIKYLLYAFFFFQPVVELTRGVYGDKLEILGISLLEIPTLLIFATLIILTVLDRYKKDKKIIIGLLLVYIVYFIFHSINVLKFNNAVYDGKISLFPELYNVVRLFIIPTLLMYVIYNAKEFKFKDLLRVMVYITVFVTFIIVVSNIFGFSFVAYDSGKRFIKGTIFTWGTYTGSWEDLTSRGLFESSNRLSSFLIISLPFVLYNAYKNRKLKDYLFLFVQILAMIMIGSRTASIGSLLVLSLFIIILLFFKYIIKEDIKFPIIYVAYLILFSLLMSISPYATKLNNDKGLNAFYKDEEKEIAENYPSLNETYKNIKNLECDYKRLDDEKAAFNISYLNELYYYHGFKKQFMKYYPIEKDYKFWCVQSKVPRYINNNSRYFKSQMIRRIVERNNYIGDKFFGIGNTFDFEYTEKDYIDQFYRLGLFGVILFIFPLIIAVGYTGIYILKNLKKNFKIQNLICPFSACLGLLFAYMGGHMIGLLFPFIYLTSISMMSYKLIRKGE